MSDRFKFRVFISDKKNSKNSLTGMFKVHSLHTGTNKAIITSLYGNCSIKLENNILMQCTGLKDKNGKLIYEGDIVNQIYEDETIYKCEVVYNNCSFQLKHIEDKNKNYINTPMYCYAINYLGHYTEKRLEVIGNIYENKELLESEG